MDYDYDIPTPDRSDADEWLWDEAREKTLGRILETEREAVTERSPVPRTKRGDDEA